jgi:hypothetical protein
MELLGDEALGRWEEGDRRWDWGVRSQEVRSQEVITPAGWYYYR